MLKSILLAGIVFSTLSCGHAEAQDHAIAQNECDLSGSCFSTGTSFPGASIPTFRYLDSTATYVGARLTPLAAPAGATDPWGLCRYISNTGNTSHFVPFRSAAEWVAFVNNARTNSPNIVLKTCTRGTTFTNLLSGDPLCPPLTVSSVLPYMVASPGHVEKRTISIPCNPASVYYAPTNDTQYGPAWTETATLTFTAKDSGDSSGAGWDETITYTGTSIPPSCIPASIASSTYGACSAGCGPGIKYEYLTDNCGVTSGPVNPVACNNGACPPPVFHWGSGSSSSSGGGAYYLNTDGTKVNSDGSYCSGGCSNFSGYTNTTDGTANYGYNNPAASYGNWTAKSGD